MPDEQRELVPPSRRPLKARPLYGGALLIAMEGLRCVAGLFLLGAVYGFVRGFWRLLMFFAGIVSLGTAVIGSDFGARLGAATGAALVPLLFGTIGSVCLVAAKRIHARLAPRPDEPSAPVIYLRSFTADSDLSRRPRVPGRLFPVAD